MKLYKAVYWLVIKSRWLKIWSKIYRFCLEKKQYKLQISNEFEPDYVDKCLRKISYQKDGFRELFDAVHSPEYCNGVMISALNNNQPNGSFDCDDYANLACNILDNKYKPFLLGVSYKKKNKFSFSGHMVCVFSFEEKYAYIGNWGFYKNFNSIEEIVEDITSAVDCDLVGYCIYDKDLKLKQVKI